MASPGSAGDAVTSSETQPIISGKNNGVEGALEAGSDDGGVVEKRDLIGANTESSVAEPHGPNQGNAEGERSSNNISGGRDSTQSGSKSCEGSDSDKEVMEEEMPVCEAAVVDKKMSTVLDKNSPKPGESLSDVRTEPSCESSQNTSKILEATINPESGKYNS